MKKEYIDQYQCINLDRFQINTIMDQSMNIFKYSAINNNYSYMNNDIRCKLIPMIWTSHIGS